MEHMTITTNQTAYEYPFNIVTLFNMVRMAHCEKGEVTGSNCLDFCFFLSELSLQVDYCMRVLEKMSDLDRNFQNLTVSHSPGRLLASWEVVMEVERVL